MNVKLPLLLMACLIVMTGCCCDDTDERQEAISYQRWADKRLAAWPHEAAIENAIISQHTLFPYHFAPDSGNLNELGNRDLGILARHYLYNSGRLNIRRGSASESLYRERVDNVVATLRSIGVEMATVRVSDGPAGGEGIASEELLHILIEDVRQTPPSYYQDPTSAAGLAGGGEE